MQDFKKVIIPGMLARGKVTKKDNDFAKRELGLTGAPDVNFWKISIRKTI